MEKQNNSAHFHLQHFQLVKMASVKPRNVCPTGLDYIYGNI